MAILTMNKKILAGIAAAAMAVSCLSVSVFAEGENEGALDLEPTATVTDEVAVDNTDTGADNTDGADESTTEVTTTTTTTTTTTAGSPKTGQSAYALAAVPVALAAVAAIAIKKKRS